MDLSDIPFFKSYWTQALNRRGKYYKLQKEMLLFVQYHNNLYPATLSPLPKHYFEIGDNMHLFPAKFPAENKQIA
jgi:hypothetical protein